MPDVPSTPPAAPAAGNDPLSAVLGAVARLAEQQQSLVELFRGAASPPPVAAPRPTGVTDDVRQLVSDLFRQHQVVATRSAARDAWLREHLADLPDAYRRLMPETDDAAALSAAEQTIRRQFRVDLKSILRPSATGESAASAPTSSPVGFQASGGASPADVIDYSKLSPLQQIAVGLRGAPPERVIADMPGAAKAGADAPADVTQPDPLSLGAD